MSEQTFQFLVNQADDGVVFGAAEGTDPTTPGNLAPTSAIASLPSTSRPAAMAPPAEQPRRFASEKIEWAQPGILPKPAA